MVETKKQIELKEISAIQEISNIEIIFEELYFFSKTSLSKSIDDMRGLKKMRKTIEKDSISSLQVKISELKKEINKTQNYMFRIKNIKNIFYTLLKYGEIEIEAKYLPTWKSKYINYNITMNYNLLSTISWEDRKKTVRTENLRPLTLIEELLKRDIKSLRVKEVLNVHYFDVFNKDGKQCIFDYEAKLNLKNGNVYDIVGRENKNMSHIMSYILVGRGKKVVKNLVDFDGAGDFCIKSYASILSPVKIKMLS